MEKITPGCYSKEGSHLFSIWTLNIAWKIEMVVFFEGSSSMRMNGKGDSSLQRISGVQQHFDLSNFQAITLLSLVAFFFLRGKINLANNCSSQAMSFLFPPSKCFILYPPLPHTHL